MDEIIHVKNVNRKIEKLERSYPFFAVCCAIYGVIFTACIYDSIWGITFPIFAAVTIAMLAIYFKKMEIKIQNSFIFCAAGVILLSISTVLTANVFVYIFNWIGIVLLLLTIMLQHMDEQHSWQFGKSFQNICILCIASVAALVAPISHGIKYTQSKEKEDGMIQKKTLKYILIGVLSAVGVLAFVLPLLIFSDQIFATIFGRVLVLFEFGTQVGILITFLVGSMGLYAFWTGGAAHNYTETTSLKVRNNNGIIGITFTGILASIYLLYSGIQILFLFLRLGDGLPGGLTYSEYARSGFWQLLAVSLINFATVVICKSVFEDHKILKTLLFVISVCTCIMTISAAYRMLLYVDAYFLSFLRVLVLWFLGILTFIMVGVMVYVVQARFRLFRYITVVVAVGYILFSFAKVDAMITRYNLQHWTEISDLDMNYMLHNTSIDAAPYIGELAKNRTQNMDPSFQMDIEEYFRRIEARDNTGKKWNYALWKAQKEARAYFK